MFLLIAIALFMTVNGNITGTTLEGGDCVCADNSTDGRTSPGLNAGVITIMSTGSCGKYAGETYDADSYTWFRITYGNTTMWVIGDDLTTGADNDCASMACSKDQKILACALKVFERNGALHLATNRSSGIQDNADAWNNVNDMCDGKQAARSNYTCSSCVLQGAPGGYTCLTPNVLQYLQRLATRGDVTVMELAGGCHGCGSRHYNGQAVDIYKDVRSTEYMNTCVMMDGWAVEDGDRIHCQFYD